MNKELLINAVMSRNPKKILNKTECYALYESGFFGNKARTWNSYEEILKSEWKGGVCMRSKKGVSRKEVRYNIKIEDVPLHIEHFQKIGIPEDMISFNQSMPDRNLILQGEVMNYQGGIYLFGTILKKPMNIALAEKSFILENDAAGPLLESRLSAESCRDLQNLLEVFPESVVEFSAYSIPVGNLAETGRNTVFWEVRNY
ncbi:hypothetical protein HY449_01670 [Candidatus Pacearchaeota archaeon]|nr:hypothetical protein [Candidatus Pacearchaeota archaeon]